MATWPAKYDGDCSICPEPIVEGDMMTTVNSRPAHADCADESPADSFNSASPYRIGNGRFSSLGSSGGGRKQKICGKCGLEKPVNGDHKCWA